jgi:molecular chaperone GrpE (heat shock protein)
MKKAKSSDDDVPLATERADDGPEARDAAAVDDRGGAASSGSLEQARSELAGLNDRYLRLAAEYSNYRRRAETEQV